MAAHHSLSQNTIKGVMNYLNQYPLFVSYNKGVDWLNTNIGTYRLKAARKVTTPWLFFLDSDDEVLNPLPDLNNFMDYDAILFQFVRDDGTITGKMEKNRPLAQSSTQRLVVKTSLYIEWMEEFIASGKIREDQWAFMKAIESNFLYFPYVLSRKYDMRCGKDPLFVNLNRAEKGFWQSKFGDRAEEINRKLKERTIN